MRAAQSIWRSGLEIGSYMGKSAINSSRRLSAIKSQAYIKQLVGYGWCTGRSGYQRCGARVVIVFGILIQR
jgi:hypothetical protein